MTLIVGATGLLGTEICMRLVTKGAPVRALVRKGSPRAEQLSRLGVHLLHGDLRDPGSLQTACRDVNTVVTTANAILSRQAGDSIESVDRDGTLALLQAAQSAGVRHFIYTSVSPTLPPNNAFVRYKHQIEAAVRAAEMRWTILQPSAFMEIHAGPLAGWDFAKGRARIMGSGRAPMCYISANDVADLAVNCVSDPRALDQALHVTGPEPLSAFDAVRIAEQITGRSFRVQRLPLPVLRAASSVIRPFNPGVGAILAMAIGMERGERTDVGHRLREFGLHPTTFAEYVRHAVSA